MAFPEDRPGGYNPDQVFDESENDWTSDLSDLESRGGERYNQQLVVLSEQGKIYFQELT